MMHYTCDCRRYYKKTNYCVSKILKIHQMIVKEKVVQNLKMILLKTCKKKTNHLTKDLNFTSKVILKIIQLQSKQPIVFILMMKQIC